MNKYTALIWLLLIPVLFGSCSSSAPKDLPPPNILWITAEDIYPFLGCYGDENAMTANLDRLAARGIVYENAFANAPVCAPARNTLITGMFPPATGAEHMRSYNVMPDFVRLYPGYLRDVGYYCTNNSKTDYNLSEKKAEWNESSRNAHWKNRRPGQPFFAIFNITICHESCLHQTINKLVHRPEDMVLPPYHPDLPAIRRDWAQFYDAISLADAAVGMRLKELEEAGLADSTIVIFYGDHGGVLGRSKRFMYETGLRVPMIVHIPELYEHLAPAGMGTHSDTPVSFIDLPPTLLNLAGIEVPDYMQGQPFLGENLPERSDYVHCFRGRMDERYDFCRTTFSREYQYTINYNPHRIYGQHLNYLWRAPSMRAWEQAYLAGDCNEVQSRFFNPKPVEELYDRASDPWGVNNLADDPAYAEVLEEFRQRTRDWQISVRDAGFMPEGLMIRKGSEGTIYEYVQSDDYPVEAIAEIAFKAATGDPENMEALREAMEADHEVIRYWGAMGAVITGKEALPLQSSLEKLLSDPVPEVQIVAAEALFKLGEQQQAIAALRRNLQAETSETVLLALNVLLNNGMEALKPLYRDLQPLATHDFNYVQRAAEYSLELLEGSGR